MTASGATVKPLGVHVFRDLIAQRHAAMLVCALALLLKLVIPTGYMLSGEHGRLAVTLCPGTVAMPAMAHDAMPGMHGRRDAPQHGSDHGREMPCAFAGLAAASLGAIDPVQLAALIAFILGIVTTAPVLALRGTPPFLRPPLRGPPLPL